ncbi:MAG: aminodeoxychorismate synthase component I [Puniceicoccaceae bacterium]
MPVSVLESAPPLEAWFPGFARRRHCVWIDGDSGGGGAGWSVLACDPVEVRRGAEADLPGWMDETADRLRGSDDHGLPFAGGLIGRVDYLGELPGYPPEARPAPDGWLGLYDRALVAHLPSGRIHAVLGGWVPGGRAELESWIRGLAPAAPPERAAVRSAERPVSNMGTEEYRAGVRTIREWIAAGDIYQANLARRFGCRAGGLRPEEVYLALRRANPAPYSAYLDCGDCRILSSSPELFLAVDAGGSVRTRPIKGTRPRSGDPVRDRELARLLRGNEKERAELLMIVDMERSDLGRVCVPGSVRAAEDFAVESFASVHHMVGEVTGRLRPGAGWSDLFAAAFPGGSVTGAPKHRAMEIIRSLEPSPRGAFCGSIGFVSAGGGGRWNIAIRTMEWRDGVIEFGVGAGIVWDSDPAAEERETLDKARGLFAALGWPLG